MRPGLYMSIKPRLLFSRAAFAFWGLSLSSVLFKNIKTLV